MRWTSGLVILVACVIPACARTAARSSSSSSPPPAVVEHEHHAPHGGALIELGEEFAHLELLYDRSTGQLTIYTLDGEAEAAVRIAQPSIDLVMTTPSLPGETLRAMAVASALTGERSGDASQFAVSRPDLRAHDSLAGRVVMVTVRGSVFHDVSFEISAKSREKQ